MPIEPARSRSRRSWAQPRAARAAAVLGLVLLGLSGCAGRGPAYAPASAGTAATIRLTSTLSFDPASVEVRSGETVEWRNVSLFTHTVTDDPTLVGDDAEVALPLGAESFSVSLPAGEVFRHRFTTPGTYRYVCMPHQGFGMHGQVVVTSP